ncbi:DsbA family protein [Hahella sp. KA22]|uniref:DsbA family protein n=1 Tax=Hahella sp. KA22 TaxID=1628392 RepID=UPI000FDEC915|nr:DsbA family protein [Hahella sp. KA22]AZZ94241.1 DsbA family protein [Hahella sp. KA22]QAY57615.1 DsbA family protein [Hahella sp. KA22]
MVELDYFYDPICGWCYAAAPLIRKARELMPVNLRAGGLMIGANRQPVNESLRRYVMPHDQRIQALTGQPFGDAYFNGLLRDQDAVFDSEPPIRAVLAAESLGGDALAMLHRLQQAHYVEGERIADLATLTRLAQSIGLDGERFTAQMSVNASSAAAHIQATRREMTRLSLRGYPSLALIIDGSVVPVTVGPYLGKPDAFAAHLEALIGSKTQNDDTDEAPFCTPDGCS